MSFNPGNRPQKQAIWALMIVVLVLSLSAIACSSAGTEPSGQTGTNQPMSSTTLTLSAAQQNDAAQQPGGQAADDQSSPSTDAQNSQSEEVFKGPGSVVITNLADNSVVHSKVIEIQGQADPGTVITIDDEIAAVGKDRTFTVSVKLDEGLNVLEITASNLQGDQGTAYLTVTFEPQQ